MTPTLQGRWQSRIFLFSTIGFVITLIASIIFNDFRGGFIVLSYVLGLGLIWDVVYTGLQRFRWDRDWPTSYVFFAGVFEAVAAWFVMKTADYPSGFADEIDLTKYIAHYTVVWVAIFCALYSAMLIFFPRWRYHGGQIGRNMTSLGVLAVVGLLMFGGIAPELRNINENDEDESGTRFIVRIENISATGRSEDFGVFNTPFESEEPGPALPDSGYEFSFAARQGERVSFATMLVQTNDLFIAPDASGLALFDNSGEAITGDITSRLILWDAGTEENEVPGSGDNQAPRQSGANTGDTENGLVQVVNDGFSYPDINELVRVTLTYQGNTFTVRIENVSGDSDLPSPLAPGFYVVHKDGEPLYTLDQPDRAEGLAALAEDGNPSELMTTFETSLGTPFAPGVFVIHTDPNPLYANLEADRGLGLEALAEDGNPGGLAGLEFVSGVFNTPVGADAPGPLLPGASYEFEVTADEDDFLSFATMFVHSNDLFVAPGPEGIALFDEDGQPFSGEIGVGLWDAGTEENEEPATGLNQAPRQAGANTGNPENGVVQLVDDEFNYPATFNLVRITITPVK